MAGIDCIAALKALSELNRLRIVRLLLKGQLGVNQISERLEMSQDNVSKHLRILKEAGLVEIRVADGVLHLTLTNLTAGVTNRVERSLDLAQTNGWSMMTNFVSPASTSEISEGTNPSWGRVFYRVVSTP